MRLYVPTLLVTSVIATTLAVTGCQNQSSSTAPAAKIYDVRGKIISLDAAKKVVTLDHEDIAGFMKAMTMEFPVSEAKVLDGLKPGDAVQGKIKTDGGNYAVTSLEKR